MSKLAASELSYCELTLYSLDQAYLSILLIDFQLYKKNIVSSHFCGFFSVETFYRLSVCLCVCFHFDLCLSVCLSVCLCVCCIDSCDTECC